MRKTLFYKNKTIYSTKKYMIFSTSTMTEYWILLSCLNIFLTNVCYVEHQFPYRINALFYDHRLFCETIYEIPNYLISYSLFLLCLT